MSKETNADRGEVMAMLGCVIPGAAVLAVGMAVYYFVAENLDTVATAAWIVAALATVALAVWLVVNGCGWLVRTTLDLWHDIHLRKAAQATAYAQSERAQIENQTALNRAHLVPVTPDAQMIPIDQVDSQVAYTLLSQRIATLEKKVPDSMHLTIKQSNAALPAPGQTVPLPTAQAMNALECWQRGFLSDPSKLLTGFDNGEPVYSPTERTYGVCVAGLPGMGKSNGMRFLTLQMVLHGGQVAIIDPAARSVSGEGLATAFDRYLWAHPAIDPDEIVNLLRQVDAFGQRRDSGQDQDLTPLLLLADEVTSLIADDEYGDEIKYLLMRINRKYRKNRIYTIGAGQDWLSGAQGGDTQLRNTYVCKAVFRIDRANAGKLLPNPKYVALAPELAEGQAIFVGHDAVARVVSVPFCPSASVAAILEQNTHPGSTSLSGKRSLLNLEAEARGSALEVAPEADREVDGSSELVINDEQMKRVKEMAVGGASTFRIVKAVFGVTGGRGLRRLMDEVNRILKRDM